VAALRHVELKQEELMASASTRRSVYKPRSPEYIVADGRIVGWLDEDGPPSISL
jgi:hypothetical protein